MLHIVMDADGQPSGRDRLELLISADLREISAETDHVARLFATSHRLRPNDFRALLYVMVAETSGRPLTSGELTQLMGLSGSAITYLVDRLIDTGHLRRESHPADRRKVLLKHGESGWSTARDFFNPLRTHTHIALAALSDADLVAAHRVLVAVATAMRHFQGELSNQDQ